MINVRCSRFELAVAVAAALAATSALPGVGICPRDTFVAGDAGAGDWFGFAVGVDGTTSVIGAPKSNADGAAYIFEFLPSSGGQWNQVVRITAGDGNPDDDFGAAVAISGDSAFVGAPLVDRSGSSPNTGAVYLFDRNSGGTDAWGEVVKFEPTDLAANDRFGLAVDVDGGTAVVAAPLHDPGGVANGGAVYVFRSDATAAGGWGLVKKVTAADAAPGDQFGFAVAIEGDLLVVGARRSDLVGTDSGAVYVFQRNEGGAENWGQLDQFIPVDAAAGDEFGSAVDLDGETILVGAWLSDARAANAGAAYIFHPTAPAQWTQIASLTADDAAAEDGFGFSVALDDGLALISSHRDDSPGADAGSAYLFSQDEGGPGAWGQLAKVGLEGGAADDRFSRSLSMDVPHAIIGAYQHDQPAGDAGAASAFSVGSEADCNDNGVCDDVDIAEGTSIDFNGNGVPDECECLGDIDGSGAIGFEDLVSLLDAWGPCPGCPEDLDANGTVGFSDLIYLIPAWGPCMF